MPKQEIINELKTIPGVGKAVAEDLWNIGIRSVQDLKDKNPQKLYDQICDYQQAQVDVCMLYTMRCAVYFVSHKKHNPELLKWWSWKDRKINE